MHQEIKKWFDNFEEFEKDPITIIYKGSNIHDGGWFSPTQ